MGWASGSYLAQELYDFIRPLVPVKNRKKVASHFIDEFDAYDADDWECNGVLFKDAGRDCGESDD